jgi:hypothetical protein
VTALICGGKFRRTIGFVALAAVVLLLFTWRHWWSRSHEFSVTYEGVLVPKPEIYRGKNCFLLRLTNLSDSDYLVYPVAHELGEAQRHRFWFLPGLVYSKDVPAIYIPIGKSEVDARTEFEPRSVKFNTIRDKRVAVSW